MKIAFDLESQNGFYEQETLSAIQWLRSIWDTDKKGWAWVQFIHPNEQNTAEVISTFVDYIDVFQDDELDFIVESINHWLLDTSTPKISIDFCWVLLALQKIRQCPRIYRLLDSSKLDHAVHFCLDWLCRNRNSEPVSSISDLDRPDGIKGCGWGDNDSEISSTIRTALAVTVINREIRFLTESGMQDPHLSRYREAAEQGIKWLLLVQNSDGGWGNLDKRCINNAYQTNHNFSYSDLKYQCSSNAASTGYVMIALKEDSGREHIHPLMKAADYLRNSQRPNGGWSIFTEIGIREGSRYTFRHFSTAWALQGLIVSETTEYNDECVINGFSYLTTLQDPNYGGWKSSPNADNYTWATCNALDTIKLLKDDLSGVKAREFLKIVCEWWEMKKEKATYCLRIKDHYFSFNQEMGLIFSLVFSVMISLMLYLVYNVISPVMAAQTELVAKMVYTILTIASAVILGLPWIVYIKNVFHNQVGGWIDAIGWVYGIITGFVLVLYQFIL